jgi:hypothetical protein
MMKSDVKEDTELSNTTENVRSGTELFLSLAHQDDRIFLLMYTYNFTYDTNSVGDLNVT